MKKPCKTGKTGIKISRTFLVSLAVLGFITVVQTAMSQSYAIDWFKVPGGGGTSTGDVYAVSGTLGQHDAGATMSGGNYSLTGGFWSLIAVVQTPGAPTLTITLSSNSVIVSWPSPSTGWSLQQCSNLAAGSWATSRFTVSDNGTTCSVTISSPTGNLFFRLAK